MADLSINLTPETRRVIDIVAGAAIGVALSAGLYELPVRVSDNVQAALIPPSNLSVNVDDERFLSAEWPLGVARFIASQNTRTAAYQEPPFKLADSLTVSIHVWATKTETVKPSASGFVDLIGLGNPIKVVDGPPSVQLGADSTLTASSSEAAKISASGFVDLIGLGNPIKIADGPPLAQLSGDLTAQPSESVKVTDVILSPFLDPLQVSSSESLKVVDQLSAGFGLAISLGESLKVGEASTFTLNPEQALPSETVKVSASGRVDLLGLGNPIKVVDGPPSAALVGTDLTTAISENYKVTDSLQVANPFVLTAVLSESYRILDGGEVELSRDEIVKIADSVSVALTPSASLTEIIKINDLGLQTLLNPEQTSVTESFKLAEIISLALDPEQAAPSETIKVTDTAFAAIDEQVTQSESFKIADAVFAAIDPEQSSLGESLKVGDTVSGLTINPEQTSPTESSKIIDTVEAAVLSGLGTNQVETFKVVEVVSLALNPEQASPAESLKVVDTVTASFPAISILLSESLEVADTGEIERSKDETIKIGESLTAVVVDGSILTATPTESLKISDTLSAAKDTLQTALAETIKIGDSGQVELATYEYLLISDSVTAVCGDNLSTAPTESLKISDALSVTKDTLQTALTETVKVGDSGQVELATYEYLLISDSVTAALSTENLTATVANESVKVTDVTFQTLTPEQISLTDSCKVIEQLTALMGGGVLQTEVFRISDVPTTLLNPEQATPTEVIKVGDGVFASLGGATVIAEALKVSEALGFTLDPEQVASSESVKVSDASPAAVLDLTASPAESVRVTDTPAAIREQAGSVVDEGVRVSDTVAAQLTVLALVIPSETIGIEEFGPAITVGTTVSIIAIETCKPAEILVLALDPEQTTVAESLKLTDTVSVILTPEQTSNSETVRVSETVTAALDKLNVEISENLSFVDVVPIIGGPPIIDSVGYYTAVIDIVGEFF